MTIKTFVAAATAFAVASLGGIAHAQDDLDDLLADLEGELSAVGGDAEEDAPADEPAETVDEPALAPETESEDSYAAESALADEDGEEEAGAEDDVAAEPAGEREEPAEETADAGDETELDDAEAAEPEAADEDVAEEPTEEAPAEEPAEEIADADEDDATEAESDEGDETARLLDELSSGDDGYEDEESGYEEPAPPSSAADGAQSAGEAVDAELLANIRASEALRRKALDEQALREIQTARECMNRREYQESARHYSLAIKLLNDKTSSSGLRRECSQGIAEGLYRAALEEDSIGRRDRAVKLMERAVDMRHPKARKQLESWRRGDDPDKNRVDVSEISHRRNDESYKTKRERELRHLKRSRQLLAQRELDEALDECELVLVSDPYNQEAIRLRESIERKRLVILRQERAAAREGMIADVDEAWRPVYAVDARELENSQSTTVKTAVGPDPERSIEQTIVKRMKDMRLPAISFKPPATIIDAVEYFRQASKDFDRPEIPIEKRGFNFVLKTPETLRSSVQSEDYADDDFTETADSSGGGQAGIPVIPMITASDISFYEALKLVCESVDYKFSVQGQIVMVMQKDMSTDELIVRDFPVSASFLEKMGGASEDMKSMQTSAFGNRRRNNDDEEENQERDWKEFFGLLGVKWPEGSSIYYVKTVGKLFVKNTADNLAEFEKVLMTVSAPVQLIEIETRFVEVCQDDLNSLGFEWILNSDYTLGVNRHIAKALGLKGGKWDATGGNGTVTTETTSTIDYQNEGGVNYAREVINTVSTTTTDGLSGGSGKTWLRNRGGGAKNMGVSGFGGEGATYQNGNRYLSTLSNHISGEGYSTNDQFMRVNAFLGNADVSMILHMLSQRSDTDLLSAPKVLTRPGEEAVMKVVTEYIYPTDYDVQLQSSQSSGGYGGGSSQSAILAVVEPQSFTMREVGVILQVTPTLTDDGNVIDLELNTQVVDEPTWKNYGMRIPFTGNSSSLQSFQGIGDILTGLSDVLTTLGTGITDAMRATFAEKVTESASSALDNLTDTSQENMTYYDAPMEQPFFHVRQIDSKVSVYPGATIVMGGLITEARKAMDDKIPFLGDIPFIGRLFRSHAEQTSKRNLLIFVTTRIVDGRGREIPRDSFNKTEEDQGVKAAPEIAAD
ncbi:MAG: type II and III secretion system protein [Kiritimatiellae bacterium]|nr:type II and III secretion system protein [Kiritimatiellia bacterium]